MEVIICSCIIVKKINDTRFISVHIYSALFHSSWKVWRKNDMPHVDNAWALGRIAWMFERTVFGYYGRELAYSPGTMFGHCHSFDLTINTMLYILINSTSQYPNVERINFSSQYHNFVHECVNSPSQWPNILKMIYGKQVQSTLYIDAT
jgi:hypothetical protein